MKIPIILFVCGLGLYCQAIAKDNDSTHSHASQRISIYIHDSLPTFHTIVYGKCDSSQLMIKQNMSEGYCCFSDFDGDEAIDYAFLLRDDSNRIWLFVFHVIGSDVNHVNIESFGIWLEKLPKLRIEIEPKGIWEAIDEKIKVYHDGILYTNEKESKSFSFYWKNNRCNKFYYD